MRHDQGSRVGRTRVRAVCRGSGDDDAGWLVCARGAAELCFCIMVPHCPSTEAVSQTAQPCRWAVLHTQSGVLLEGQQSRQCLPSCYFNHDYVAGWWGCVWGVKCSHLHCCKQLHPLLFHPSPDSCPYPCPYSIGQLHCAQWQLQNIRSRHLCIQYQLSEQLPCQRCLLHYCQGRRGNQCSQFYHGTNIRRPQHRV